MPTLDSPGLVDALRAVVVATLPELLAIPEALTPALFAVDPSGATPLSMPFLVLLCGEPRSDTDTAVWSTRIVHPVEFLYVSKTDGDGATDTAQVVRGKLDALIRAFQQDYHLTITGPDSCGRVTLTELLAPAMNRTNAVQQMMSEGGYPVTAMSLLMEFTVVTSWYTPPLPPPPAPEAFWSMEGASNTAVPDSAGSLDLSCPNGAASGSGKIGAARTLAAASSQYLKAAGSDPALSFTGDFTLALWFKLDSLPSGTPYYLAAKGVSPKEFELLFQTSGPTPSLVMQPYAGSSPSGFVSLSGLTINPGEWHLVTAWRDTAAGELGIQLDDGTPATSAFSGSVSSGVDFILGAYFNGSSRFFDGSLDAVAKWNLALSEEERESLWNGGAGREFDGTEWS